MARQRTSASEAARRIQHARKELVAARKALALAPRRQRDAPHIFAGEWQTANSALERSRATLGKLPGVVGHGLGRRVKGGIETDEPCVVVFVREKRTPADLRSRHLRPVPKALAVGKKSVGTDIVQIGHLVRQAGLESIGVPGSGGFGTIGAFGTDIESDKPVAITAMHVSGLSQLDTSQGDQALDMASPSDGETIGQLVLGTTTGIDAAKVILTDSAELTQPLPIVGFRPVSNDRGISVRLFGAGSQKILYGAIKYLNVNLEDDGESLENTILASIPTVHGDSGAGLVDDSGFLLGILFGIVPADLPIDLRVFSPAAAVVSFLRCSIP